MFVVNTIKTFKKISATQLKSRLKAYSVLRRLGLTQYIRGHDIEKEPKTHETHTY